MYHSYNKSKIEKTLNRYCVKTEMETIVSTCKTNNHIFTSRSN